MLVALLRVSIIGHMLNKSGNVVYEAADRWLNIQVKDLTVCRGIALPSDEFILEMTPFC
jgi:hypothetical protein